MVEERELSVGYTLTVAVRMSHLMHSHQPRTPPMHSLRRLPSNRRHIPLRQLLQSLPINP
jgi:hypothetical protein